MKVQKVTIVILILIITYFLIPRENITVVTQMSENETKGLEKILKSYSLTHFVKFDIRRIPFSGHFSRIKEIIDSNQEVDIARVDIKMPEWFKKYTYGEPTLQAVDCLVMLYNKKYVDAPPNTLDELWNFIEENTVDINGHTFKSSDFNKSKIDKYAIYLPYNSGWWMSTIFGSEDKNFLTKKVNKEKFIKIAEKIKYLYKNQLIPKSSEDFYDDMIKMFSQNEVKIIYNGPWSFSTLKDKKIDFGISLIPKGEDTRFSPMGGQQWVILNNKKIVNKVFKYLSSDKVAEQFYKYNNTIMPNRKLLEELEKKGDIVASQLKMAIPIDNKIDYILYKFFSNDFVDYLNDQITSEQLFNNWMKMIKGIN
ncbi:sugar ABC transporter substrate-binding protein [Marinitoga aeolica]|uniref:Extracellular solute-binding protein n=1 Tax=Marinitoga aeolica TaxID=2809031 RepID=A0ABY8PS58_9BACT|nr:extracellular solute-binding protein [Marinitoga aeolica]WGS65457.1 extracellular solute-binding protein [Marinitoga aeolica]